MAEESAYQRVKSTHEDVIAINSGHGMPLSYGQGFKDIAELLADHERMQAELETVRAERDALRAALEAVRGECNWDYHSLDAMLRNITHIINAALNTQPQAEWTPRRMQIKTGYSAYFYRENKQTALTFQDGDIVIAGETDHNGTHVRNLEDNAGALIPTEYLAPVDESEAQAEWTPRFVVGETVRVDRFIDDAFAGWLGEIEQIKRVGDTCEYYLAAKNHPGFERYPFGWFAEKLLDNNDNVPDWVEGMDKEAD